MYFLLTPSLFMFLIDAHLHDAVPKHLNPPLTASSILSSQFRPPPLVRRKCKACSQEMSSGGFCTMLSSGRWGTYEVRSSPHFPAPHIFSHFTYAIRRLTL